MEDSQETDLVSVGRYIFTVISDAKVEKLVPNVFDCSYFCSLGGIDGSVMVSHGCRTA